MQYTKEQIESFYKDDIGKFKAEVTYESIEPESILDELKEHLAEDISPTTVNFIRVDTPERMENILEVLRQGKYKVQIWKRTVDNISYQPMLYLIATRRGDTLSVGIKFFTSLELTVDYKLSESFEDYYNPPRDFDNVLQILKDLPASPQIKGDIRYIGDLVVPQIEAENV